MHSFGEILVLVASWRERIQAHQASRTRLAIELVDAASHHAGTEEIPWSKSQRNVDQRPEMIGADCRRRAVENTRSEFGAPP